MARKPQQQTNEAVGKTDDEVVAEANALAVAEALAPEEGQGAPTKGSVCVRAVHNRMRNPYTGAVFNKARGTDVINLESQDNAWTRDQIRAKVLEII